MESPIRSTSPGLEPARKRKMLQQAPCESDVQSDDKLPSSSPISDFAVNHTAGMNKQPQTNASPDGCDTEALQAKADTGMDAIIQQIRQKMDNFTQQVSSLLDAGKAYFQLAASDFEERIFQLHQSQMEKWEDEIQNLVSLHEENEETSDRLRNAQDILGVLQSV